MGADVEKKDKMLHLTTLPTEILHHIFALLNPADIVILPRVCSMIRDFVKGNRPLFRDLYLNHLDRPNQLDLDWDTEIHDIAHLQVLCRSKHAATKYRQEIGFVSDVVDRLLKNASASDEPIPPNHTHAISRNASLLNEIFETEASREAFLQRSSLFDRARSEAKPSRFSPRSTSAAIVRQRQRSAKLHCLYGKPIQQTEGSVQASTYPFACSKVYDLRQYTARTRWGPFLDDDSDHVDWEKVEAILIVLSKNVGRRHRVTSLFKETWGKPFSGSWARSYKSPSPLGREISSLEASDPYDVTGTWYRIVCFLDYTDFFAFNFPAGDFIEPDMPRPALDGEEATRIIMMRIHVDRIEPPGPNDGQDLPVVHFKGVSCSLDTAMDDANSRVRGSVRLTREGEVRWTTFSIFHGQERWRSEGVQVGGIRSARGVVGNWFDREYDVHGPAGPTAFWKGPAVEQNLLPHEFLAPTGFFAQYGAMTMPPPLILASDDEGDEDYQDGDGHEDEEEGEEEEEEGEAGQEGIIPTAVASSGASTLD